MTKLVQFNKFFMNMKIWTNIETYDILHRMQWEWHTVRIMVMMKHDGDSDNPQGDA